MFLFLIIKYLLKLYELILIIKIKENKAQNKSKKKHSKYSLAQNTFRFFLEDDLPKSIHYNRYLSIYEEDYTDIGIIRQIWTNYMIILIKYLIN